jgi:hypothetical protein
MSHTKPLAEKIGNINPFGLRMLPDLKNGLEASATANGRSLNSEIVARLEDSSSPSLRDRFAMAALQSISPFGLSAREVAEAAYMIADAMLAERAKGGA